MENLQRPIRFRVAVGDEVGLDRVDGDREDVLPEVGLGQAGLVAVPFANVIEHVSTPSLGAGG